MNFKWIEGCDTAFSYEQAKAHVEECREIPYVQCLLLCGDSKFKGMEAMIEHLTQEC